MNDLRRVSGSCFGALNILGFDEASQMFKIPYFKPLFFKIFLLVISAGLSLGLVGCEVMNNPQPEPTPIPTVAGEVNTLVEGRLVPIEHVNLSFNLGGVVTEIFVQEGDLINPGQAIARLDQRERLAATVASAELELVNGRQALKTLEENAEVSSAAALQAVANARDAVRYAERCLNNLNSGSRGTDIDKARADVVLLKDRLDQARKDFAAYENKPEDNVTRAQYLSRLADAQRKYDDIVRLLNNLEGNPSDIDLAIAEANLALSQAQLSLAEQEYEDVKAGPDPDALDIAQARLKAAETGLASAMATLADTELVAPISGTLVKLDLKTGEQAIPGVPVAVLADLSGWQVETEDLNEMDLPDVAIGQAVIIVPDALPELELAGTVKSIGQLFEVKFGDITYTAVIALQDSDPRLRWGMTVAVQFEP